MSQHERTLTIIIEGGVLQEIENLPDGWNYTLIDLDLDRNCDCEVGEPFEYGGVTRCHICGGVYVAPSDNPHSEGTFPWLVCEFLSKEERQAIALDETSVHDEAMGLARTAARGANRPEAWKLAVALTARMGGCDLLLWVSEYMGEPESLEDFEVKLCLMAIEEVCKFEFSE